MKRAVLVLASAAVLAGCGSSSGSPSSAPAPTGAGSAASGKVAGRITVLAAASLKESFTALGKQFEAANPGTKVVFSFGASSDLAAQVTNGAPADVFASASAKTMDTVVKAGKATSPEDFATNSMEIAVPRDNPAHVKTVADLARAGVKVALCQAQVPCGATAAKVFTNAKVTVEPVTLEADVKATLTKVSLGEVDAGVVYVTDVKAAGTKVLGVPIPAATNASTAYPLAVLKGAKNPGTAKAFEDFVLSDAGQQVLAAAGFEKP
ncbi:molybdate transport system substrate-binding protein [Motilibacter rhizosphaerae]|uniref:Molybdate transport system substrate-binding protein n=1 Tax=Motilibacter rhizosphaerae TaxID=598652 RepID=A0A4Q7NUQ8_9ACTN|nr:molybdate ABC transporter substrate-binding protein [Motilibacter rhizosphaerae]RZS90956.1 molybdate transport system substrate-binding protein [Motilibacter rhizosphaerae]